MQRRPGKKCLNCQITNKLWDELDKYSKETGISKTFVLETSITDYLTEEKLKKEGKK